MDTSTKNRAIYGFISDFLGQFAVMAINIFTVPLILNFTSQLLYGFWLTTSSIIGFLALTDFGISLPLIRSISANTSPDRNDNLNRIVSTGFFSLLIICFVFICIGLIFSFFIPGWFKIPIEYEHDIMPAYYVAVLSAAISLPLGIFSNVLNGFQRMAIDNSIKNCLSILCIGISILLLYEGFGILSIAISNLVLVVFSSLLNLYYTKKNIPNLEIKFNYISRDEITKLLKFGGFFQLGRIANTVALSADNVVISSVLGTSLVTPYSLTAKLPNLFSVNIASKLPMAVFPAISKLFAEGEDFKLQKIFIKLANLSTRLATMAAFFVFIVNEKFITLWVGFDNYGGFYLNLVFVYWVLQDTIYRGTTAFIYASGDLKYWTIASILEALFNIVLSVILAINFGLIGVALGTSISKTITTGFSTPYFISIKLNLPFFSFIRVGLLKPILISIFGLLLTWLCINSISINQNWIWIMIVGFLILFFNIALFEGVIIYKSKGLTVSERLKKITSFE